jgi:hypothetical protein
MTIRSVAASAAVLTLLGAGTALAAPVAGYAPIPDAGPLTTQSCLGEGGQPAYMNGEGYCVLSGRSAAAGAPPVAPEGGVVEPESTLMMTEGSCGRQGGRIIDQGGRPYCMVPIGQ